MFCFKENCSLNIAKFDSIENPEYDCVLHLIGNILEHYNALKKRAKRLESICNKYERRLKRVKQENSDTEAGSIVKIKKERNNQQQNDSNDCNNDNDNDVIHSTYNVAIPMARKPYKSFHEAYPEKPKKPKQTTTTIASNKMFIAKKSITPTIQPTIKSFIQPKLTLKKEPETQIPTKPHIDENLTFCAGLESQLCKENIPSSEKFVESPSPPKRKSLALFKNRKRPIDHNSSMDHENDFDRSSTCALFDTEDETVNDSVIVLSNKKDEPITIEDLSRDSEDLSKMERNCLAFDENEDKSNKSEIPWGSYNYRESPQPSPQKSEVDKFLDDVDCIECKDYYKFLLRSYSLEEIKSRKLKCSNHKKRNLRASTPEGFWNVAFTETQN